MRRLVNRAWRWIGLRKVQAVGAVSAWHNLVTRCPELSLQRQGGLVGISRSGFYYEPVPEISARGTQRSCCNGFVGSKRWRRQRWPCHSKSGSFWPRRYWVLYRPPERKCSARQLPDFGPQSGGAPHGRAFFDPEGVVEFGQVDMGADGAKLARGMWVNRDAPAQFGFPPVGAPELSQG